MDPFYRVSPKKQIVLAIDKFKAFQNENGN